MKRLFKKMAIALAAVITVLSIPISVSADDLTITLSRYCYCSDEFEFGTLTVIDETGADVSSEYTLYSMPYTLYRSGDSFCITGETDENGNVYPANTYQAIILYGTYSVEILPCQIGVRGDTNLDGKITTADASLILQECACNMTGTDLGLTDIQKYCGNVDNLIYSEDNKITTKDASEILYYSASTLVGKTYYTWYEMEKEMYGIE